MNTVKATFRDGRVEPEEPLDLPEGTKLLIAFPSAEIEFMTEDEQGDDPAAIREWIDDLRSIPPVPKSPEDEAESRAWDEKMRDYNLEAVRKQFEEGTP